MKIEQINNKRISAYHILQPLQKAMIRILAVNIDYCRLNKIIACLTDLGFSDNAGSKLNTSTIQPVLNELIDEGLLLKSTRGLYCPDSIQREALYDVLMAGEFPVITRLIQKHIFRLNPNARGNPFKNYRNLVGTFQTVVFTTESTTDINDIDNIAAYYFKNEYYNNNYYLHIFCNPFSPELIEKVHPNIRFNVLSSILDAANASLEKATEIVKYISESSLPMTGEKYIIFSLIFHHLISGNTIPVRSLLAGLDDNLRPEQLSRTAWLEFISGNYEKALQIFEKNLTRMKKITGKRKLFLRSYAGLFHLLALLQTGENKFLEKGLTYIGIAEKEKFRLSGLMQIMEPVFLNQLGRPVDGPVKAWAQNIYNNPLEFFFANLALAWSNREKALAERAKIKEIRDKAQENDYTWLAAELSALLALLGQEKVKNNALATKLHKSCNTRSFVGMITEKPKWEMALNALINISDTDRKNRKTRPAEQRLTWLFSHSAHIEFCQITPRLQKKRKNGGWTKGRPVALKNLYKNYLEMEGLTEQDRNVCRAISDEYYRTGMGYHKTEYYFDNTIALPALVGHPLLFLKDSPDVRVELVLSEPALQLQKEKDKLKLSISPVVTDSEEAVVVVQDTPTRFKVVRFSQKHQQICKILGTGLTIPESGNKLIKQVIDSMSSVVTVHSDLAADHNNETIKADSRLHAHLLPRQDGICLEFLVKPFGSGGSSFRPGKGSKSVLSEIKGKKIQANRDLFQEKILLNKIIKSCPTLDRLEAVEHQYLVDEPEDALELLLELKECGDDVVLEWPRGEKLAVRKKVSSNSFSLQIKKDRDWFQATGSLDIDDSLALDLNKLLDMLSRATGRFIPLDDGTFLAITRQLRKRLEELAAFSERDGRGVRFAPLAALALTDLTEEAGELKCDNAWKQHCRQLNEVVKSSIPSTLQASLRDYQKTGFNWLAQLSHWGVGGCLADDMGLGKTVQALAAILLRAARGPSLVVAPLSVTSNWQDEARRFTPTLNVIVFGPGGRQQVIADLQPFDLLIVSYGLLPIEEELLCKVKWQTVVLDEAQAIKNMKTRRSKAAMQLQAEFRIITTGTPVENHLGELWTLFNFLNPGLLGSFKTFTEKFAIPIERNQNTQARNRLRKLIRPFILRRLKTDVLQELPDKTEITLTVEMSREEMLLYEAQRLKALENISAHDDEGAGQQHLRILGEIMKLRRLCCNPRLVLPDSDIKSSKLKVFGDTLNELLSSKHKALVFSQFVDHLKIIRRFLEEKNISYQYLDGSTPIKKRKQIISSFQNGYGDVFLISLKAGGSGLNLTAADYVIHMDPWWNPAVEDQASDRAHRIGQERPVTVYRLVVKDSIEEQIVDLHKQKRELAESLLEGADSAGKISAGELLSLLQGKELGKS